MAKKDSQRILEIREKANQQRREEQRREKRKTIFIQAGIVALVLLVMGGIFAYIVMSNGAPSTPGAAPSAQANVTVNGVDGVPLVVGGNAVTLGKKDAPVTIDLYEDYSCPHCADYEAAVGPTLLSLAAKGDAVVNFYPIRFVTNYGLNAGSAGTCVATKNSQNWPEFHTALFANHSQESDGWGASDFADFAESQGITDKETLSCIKKNTYANWITTNTKTANEVGVKATPSLFINGTLEPELLGPDALLAKVNSLKGN